MDLARFRAVLQVDGYNGFKALAGVRTEASVTLAFCWLHMRRHFYDHYVSDKSRLAAEVMMRVRELYAIEAKICCHRSSFRVSCARSGRPALCCSWSVSPLVHIIWLHKWVEGEFEIFAGIPASRRSRTIALIGSVAINPAGTSGNTGSPPG